ncbi:hypothetical protein [Aliiroseovarius lamellibrachiae]|uniref:hypothetical protein n=1 Tax=Aliiroseovarius lamellibrachiae TaxID=1924933 RepID=UPI001BE0314F|nr:hypothetical protein [Aliiroseovarius lamellibrachiae]
MTAARGIERVLNSTIAISACVLVFHDQRQISSAFKVMKNVVTAALSQRLPLPQMDPLKPCSRKKLLTVLRTVLVVEIDAMNAAFG